MKLLIILIMSLFLTSCYHNTIKRTTYLNSGMSTSEVRSVMGDPSSTEFLNGYMVWKYRLFRYGAGHIPYDLAFDKDKKLVSWQADMNEYYAKRELDIQAANSLDSLFPKQHNVNIRGNMKHNVNVQGNMNHNASNVIVLPRRTLMQ
jgi:hypothetical protein